MKLMIAAIHNQEDDRIDGLRATCLELKNKLTTDGIDVDIKEFYKQTHWNQFRLTLIQWYLLRINFLFNVAQWEKYLLKQNSIISYLRHLFSAFSIPTRELISAGLNKQMRKKVLHEKFKELALWRKHQLARIEALQSNVDALLVLESDARLSEHGRSSSHLESLVKTISSSQRLFYVQVGQGYPLDQDMAGLVMTLIEDQANHRSVCFDRPSTNTTSAYLVNTSFLDKISEFETLRLRRSLFFPVPLAADWYINSFFLWLHRTKASQVTALHPVLPIFSHGSLNGELASTFSFH